jgi:chromate transporter
VPGDLGGIKTGKTFQLLILIIKQCNMQQPTYKSLFLNFSKIGLTAFGGLAMTAHIRKHVVDKKGWLTEESFDSGLALCQVIPGAIVMQLAAYIGLKLRGVRGAIVSFIGFGLPAFLVMFILSVLYKHTKNIYTVEIILNGLRIVIVAIVANAAYIFGRKNFHHANDILIGTIAAILFLIKLHPAVVLVIASFLGIFLSKNECNTPTEAGKSRTFRFFLLLLGIVACCAVILFFVNKSYFILATVMLRIDLFSFGGGLAAMPIMYHEFIDIFSWFDEKTFMDGVILGQVTPGSIIIAATFFGYMKYGVVGSLLSTICVFTPSFLILMGIVPFFDKLKSYPQFNKVINGILCSFVGLLVVITYRFTIGIHWNVANIAFVLTAFILLVRKVEVIWIIAGGILFSLIHW